MKKNTTMDALRRRMDQGVAKSIRENVVKISRGACSSFVKHGAGKAERRPGMRSKKIPVTLTASDYEILSRISEVFYEDNTRRGKPLGVEDLVRLAISSLKDSMIWAYNKHPVTKALNCALPENVVSLPVTYERTNRDPKSHPESALPEFVVLQVECPVSVIGRIGSNEIEKEASSIAEGMSRWSWINQWWDERSPLARALASAKSKPGKRAHLELKLSWPAFCRMRAAAEPRGFSVGEFAESVMLAAGKSIRRRRRGHAASLAQA